MPVSQESLEKKIRDSWPDLTHVVRPLSSISLIDLDLIASLCLRTASIRYLW